MLTFSTKCIIILESQGRNGSMPRDCRAVVRAILYPWLSLFTIKRPIQCLICLANLKIRVLYFGEVDVELVFVQQFC